jgi:hypothetical protein
VHAAGRTASPATDMRPGQDPNLLARLNADLGLDRFLERIGWHGLTSQQVSHAVLGRLPQDIC